MRQTLSSPTLEGAPRLVDPDTARPERRAPCSLMFLAHLHARAMLVVFPRAPSTPSSWRARDGTDPQARLLQSSWPAREAPTLPAGPPLRSQ